MLAIRLNCENCDKELPMDSTEARICTFECTFCATCVEEVLQNVCPNCGGGFEKRPIRPKKYLEKYPPTTKRVYQPVDMEKFKALLEKVKDLKPEHR